MQVSVGEQDGWRKRMTEIKVEMERWRAEMRGSNRRKESRRLLRVLISKRSEEMREEDGGRVVYCLGLVGQCRGGDDCSSI